MKPEDYNTAPELFKNYLTPEEFNKLELRHKTIRKNTDNFIKTNSIIHGDFHYNNILWDKKEKKITGIIDWAEAGIGTPAMDFIGIANFNDPKNDEYLREILSFYGDKDDKLFHQIKQNKIIDTMNWFWWYYKNNQKEGQREWIKKLKEALSYMI